MIENTTFVGALAGDRGRFRRQNPLLAGLGDRFSAAPDVWPELLAIATPRIYEQNPFRLLGLEVNVHLDPPEEWGDAVDLDEIHERVEARHLTRALAPARHPGRDSVRLALEWLHQPLTRLACEIFWFWPDSSDSAGSESTAEALRRGAFKECAQVWLRRERKGLDRCSATHNLAVLYHLRALSLQRRLEQGQLGDREFRVWVGCWRGALRRWRLLFDDDAFWRRISVRAEALDVPAAGPLALRRIRQTLPRAVLQINASLAIDALQKDHEHEYRTHLELLETSGFEPDLVREVLESCGEDLVDQTRFRTRALVASVESDPSRGAERIDAHLTEMAVPLRVMRTLFDSGHALRRSFEDELGASCRDAVVAFANSIGDWPEAIRLFKAIEVLPASESQRESVRENLDAARDNLLLTRCFFCEQEDGGDQESLTFSLYGEVHLSVSFTGSARILWRRRDIRVPRCRTCRDAHRDSRALSLLGGTGGFLLASGLGFLSAGWLADGELALGIWSSLAGALVALGGIALLAASFRYLGPLALCLAQRPVKPLRRYREYAPIEELRRLGWSFGTAPQEAKAVPRQPVGSSPAGS